MILLECIKGYAHEEGIVCLQGDVVEVLSTEDGEVLLEGKHGWSKGIEITFSPKVVAEYFKFHYSNQE